MNLAAIVTRYEPQLRARYGQHLLPSHEKALTAIRQCRTPAAGERQLQCTACQQTDQHALSCGHRSCPQCLYHQTTQWLERQTTKLLPVNYFMVTFTLPAQLRALAWRRQRTLYSLLLQVAADTLRSFGLNHSQLQGELGLTTVLHTHNRRLGFHPHVHVIVPGGALDSRRKQWRTLSANFLFYGAALAKVFHARLLAALRAAQLPLPSNIPKNWVVDCKAVGRGLPALQYLSRYLYRGVINEDNLLADQNGEVTFNYVESKTGCTRTRTLKGEDFLWLVLQHVLPRGFRRVRDYGFLHGNAKKRRALVQLALRVIINAAAPKPRRTLCCRHCHAPMAVVGVTRRGSGSG